MTSLSHHIAQRIEGAILAHRLVPGTKLGERELGEILGASRIVIRQALLRLAEDGLVTIERNRGAFVSRPTLAEAIDVYEALILVEKGIVAQLCDDAASTPLDRLIGNIDSQRAATESGDHECADQLGNEFHSELINLSRNRVIGEIHSQLSRRSRLLQVLYPRDYDRCRLCDDHSRLVQLIEQRQVTRARNLIEAHYRAILRGFRIESELPPVASLEAVFESTTEPQPV